MPCFEGLRPGSLNEIDRRGTGPTSVRAATVIETAERAPSEQATGAVQWSEAPSPCTREDRLGFPVRSAGTAARFDAAAHPAATPEKSGNPVIQRHAPRDLRLCTPRSHEVRPVTDSVRSTAPGDPGRLQNLLLAYRAQRTQVHTKVFRKRFNSRDYASMPEPRVTSGRLPACGGRRSGDGASAPPPRSDMQRA
jgi:hypothetical protein